MGDIRGVVRVGECNLLKTNPTVNWHDIYNMLHEDKEEAFLSVRNIMCALVGSEDLSVKFMRPPRWDGYQSWAWESGEFVIGSTAYSLSKGYTGLQAMAYVRALDPLLEFESDEVLEVIAGPDGLSIVKHIIP